MLTVDLIANAEEIALRKQFEGTPFAPNASQLNASLPLLHPIEKHCVVKPSPFGGDGLFATKDISVASVIFTIGRPLVAALDTNCLRTHCSNCFLQAFDARDLHDPNAQSMPVKACSSCHVLHYCSKKCQKESWKRHHKDECKLFAKYADKGPLPNAMRAVLQMLSLSTAGEPALFKSLMSNEDALVNAGGERWSDIQLFASGIKQMFRPNVDQALIQRYLAVVQTNSFTLSAQTLDPIGVALDPLAVKANHSCEPNASVIFDRQQMSFRTLRPIAKNEEIFIQYVDTSMPFARRQTELKQQYFFDCACSKCGKGPKLMEDMFSKHSLPQPANKATAAPGRSPMEAPRVPSPSEVEDSRALRLPEPPEFEDRKRELAKLTHTENLVLAMLDHYKTLGAPTASVDSRTFQRLEALEAGIMTCWGTRKWFEHRQPIPAFRHEVFQNLLNDGFDGFSWSYAFLQGMNIYFFIHPVLYLQSWHPTRMAHMWALVKLSMYLVMPDVPKAPELNGVDFGYVTYGLLLELKANIWKSHGECSTFAGAVRTMLDQAKRDNIGEHGIRQNLSKNMDATWVPLKDLVQDPDTKFWRKALEDGRRRGQ